MEKPLVKGKLNDQPGVHMRCGSVKIAFLKCGPTGSTFKSHTLRLERHNVIKCVIKKRKT
jgi:hypothetical protein